ncbi:GNAT family N-acetyltransferase [Allostreptomyces psammosilenae]|uniref:GNAT superfamily N-acetyltransferase n=1 Tax=Allostreptomyces psammosilenae TaxID=1892865 RepID=A0A853ACX6_9ACTN|nr:GNAT family N-acetyltransferase [Allostreptomyces psammosilenae]NYI08298.1 GNAT superfamily N-acetyltransferase [Allostreptomyces psammosilenae]
MDEHAPLLLAVGNAVAQWSSRAELHGWQTEHGEGWLALRSGADGRASDRVLVTRRPGQPETVRRLITERLRDWGSRRSCIEDPFGVLDLSDLPAQESLHQAVMVRCPGPARSAGAVAAQGQRGPAAGPCGREGAGALAAEERRGGAAVARWLVDTPRKSDDPDHQLTHHPAMAAERATRAPAHCPGPVAEATVGPVVGPVAGFGKVRGLRSAPGGGGHLPAVERAVGAGQGSEPADGPGEWPDATPRPADGPGQGPGRAAHGARPAVWEATDAAELAEVERAIVHGFPLPAHQPYRRGGLLPPGLLDVPGWRFWLGRLDGRTAAGAFTFDDGRAVGLYSLATLPEFRSRGVAGAVVDAVLAAHPDRYVTLTATPAGQPLYRSRGFVVQTAARWWRTPAVGRYASAIGRRLTATRMTRRSP